jgi:hypothetical protein
MEDNFDPNFVEQAAAWKIENSWYDEDPVMKVAADQLDDELDKQGVPVGKERFDRITAALRESYPAHFYDHPEPKPTWNSIVDPAERQQAKAAFERLKHTLQYTTRKVSEQEYLKDYLGR